MNDLVKQTISLIDLKNERCKSWYYEDYRYAEYVSRKQFKIRMKQLLKK